MNSIIKKNLRLILALTLIQVIAHRISFAQKVLTLDECLKLATENNNNIKLAQENVYAANEVKGQREASSKPAVNGSMLGFYFGHPINAILPEYGISPSVGVSQTIYSGGRAKLGNDAATKGLEIQEERKVLAVNEVIFNTERTYWQVISAREQIKLAEQNKKQLDALYNDLNNQFLAGMIYKNDVLRVKVQSMENELGLKRAQDAQTIAIANLLHFIGVADSTSFIIPDNTLDGFDSQIFENNKESVSESSEIVVLKKSIEAQEIQRQLLIAESKPSVGLSLNGLASYGKAGINPVTRGTSLTTYYGILNVNIPILDWGVRKRRVKEQQHRINAQFFQIEERKAQISIEVTQGNLQLSQSVKRIELTKAALFQSEENLKLSTDRLKAGTISGREVLEAQSIWQLAYSNAIEAKIEYKISEANLRRLLSKEMN